MKDRDYMVWFAAWYVEATDMSLEEFLAEVRNQLDVWEKSYRNPTSGGENA